MAPTVREKARKAVETPVGDLLKTPPLVLPEEAFSSGSMVEVAGLGVPGGKAVVVSPTLSIVGSRIRVPLGGAAGLRNALRQ